MEAEIGVSPWRPLEGHRFRESQLYRLLCGDAAKCRLVRHLSIDTFGIFDLKPLLSGCNTLTSLHLDMDGPRLHGQGWTLHTGLLEGVGRTLKTLSLTLWCTIIADAWKELLEPLECVERPYSRLGDRIQTHASRFTGAFQYGQGACTTRLLGRGMDQRERTPRLSRRLHHAGASRLFRRFA